MNVPMPTTRAYCETTPVCMLRKKRDPARLNHPQRFTRPSTKYLSKNPDSREIATVRWRVPLTKKPSMTVLSKRKRPRAALQVPRMTVAS